MKQGTLLRDRFGEHLQSIGKNVPGFPVVEHFDNNCHPLNCRSLWHQTLQQQQTNKTPWDAIDFQARHQWINICFWESAHLTPFPNLTFCPKREVRSVNARFGRGRWAVSQKHTLIYNSQQQGLNSDNSFGALACHFSTWCRNNDIVLFYRHNSTDEGRGPERLNLLRNFGSFYLTFYVFNNHSGNNKCLYLDFFLADPPSYDGGAVILGYIIEMENPGTKGENVSLLVSN